MITSGPAPYSPMPGMYGMPQQPMPQQQMPQQLYNGGYVGTM